MIKYTKIHRGGQLKTSVSVMEGYRPGPGLPPKQRTVKSFGYLEDQPDREAFMGEVRQFNATFKEKAELRIEVASTARMYGKESRRQNYGHKFLEAVYGRLGIGGFINGAGRRGMGKTEEIFRFLVLLRVLSPCSKRASSQQQGGFYGMEAKYTLPEVYRALGKMAALEAGLQRHLNGAVKECIGRGSGHVFYDATNLYFESDFPDADGGLRQRGVSKEHRTDPIAGFGLLMDSNAVPIGMAVFPGNTSESMTLGPAMRELKEAYGLGRLVVVADKAMNTSSNIGRIVGAGDGYVVSQPLRGTRGKRYQEALLDEKGYIENADGTFRHKIFEEEYEGLGAGGMKAKHRRKVLICWSLGDEARARRKREDKLERAERAIRNGTGGIKKGYAEYIKEEGIDRETGERIGGRRIKKARSVDRGKAEDDSKYDGYSCIITSELEYGEAQIRAAYGGLWRLEESFRILKSDLYARPVFVWTEAHIRAHFLICFTALLIVRFVQHRMGKKALTAERMAAALSAATCRVLKGGIVQLDDVGGAMAFRKAKNAKGELVDTLQFSGEDEIALDYRAIQEAFKTDFYSTYSKQEAFSRFLKSISVP